MYFRDKKFSSCFLVQAIPIKIRICPIGTQYTEVRQKISAACRFTVYSYRYSRQRKHTIYIPTTSALQRLKYNTLMGLEYVFSVFR